MRSNKLYVSLAGLFWFVRQFFIPNPFEVLGDGITVTIKGTPVLLTPDTLNWIAGLGLPAFTYLLVGLYYNRGENPALGSVLYMAFFCIHTWLLHLMSLAYPAYWLMILIGVVYIGIHVVAFILINRRGCI